MMRYKAHNKATRERQEGFTFIELLVSMSIIILVGTIVLIIFFAALRGTDKTQSLITMRHNGNHALTQIVSAVRHAEAVVNYAACSQPGGATTLEIASPVDHLVTTYRCTEVNIASEGANGIFYMLDETQVAPHGSCTFTCGLETTTQIPYVSIVFALKKARTVPPNDVITPLEFKSTVQLRNTIAE